MALLARTQFAQQLLGIGYVDASPLDFVNPFSSMMISQTGVAHDFAFSSPPSPPSTSTAFACNPEFTVLRKYSSSSKGNEAHLLYYQAVLDMTGFKPEDIRIKLRRPSLIDISAKGKRHIGTTKNDFLKLQYKKRLNVPKNALIRQSFIYFTPGNQLVIKIPIDHIKQGVEYPVSMINTNAFHERLNNAVRLKIHPAFEQDPHTLSNTTLTSGNDLPVSYKRENDVKVTLVLPENVDQCNDLFDVKIQNGCLTIRGKSNRSIKCKEDKIGNQLSSSNRNHPTLTEYFRSIKLPGYVNHEQMQWNRDGRILNVVLKVMEDLEAPKVENNVETTYNNDQTIP